MAEDIFDPTHGAAAAGSTDYSAWRPSDIDIGGSIAAGWKESIPGMMWNFDQLSGEAVYRKVAEHRKKGASDYDILYTIASKPRYGDLYKKAKKNLNLVDTGQLSAKEVLDALGEKFPVKEENPALHKNAVNLVFKSLASLVPDLPAWIGGMAGATAASGGNPVLGLAGASAITTAMKSMLMRKIENGDIASEKGLKEFFSSDDFWKEIVPEIGKSAAVGAVAGVGGRVPSALVAGGKGAKLGLGEAGYTKGIAHGAKPSVTAELTGYGEAGATALSKTGEKLKVGGELGGFLVGGPVIEGHVPQNEEEWVKYIAGSVVPILGLHYGNKTIQYIRGRMAKGHDPAQINEDLQTKTKGELEDEINRYESGYDAGLNREATREPEPAGVVAGSREVRGEDLPLYSDLEPTEPRYVATDAMGAPVGEKGKPSREEPVLGPRGELLGRKRGAAQGAAVDTTEREEGPPVFDPRTGKIVGKREVPFEEIDPVTGEHIGWLSPLGFSKQWDMSLADYLLRYAEREFVERGKKGEAPKYTEDEVSQLSDMILHKSPTESDFLFLTHKLKAALDKPGFARDALDQVLLQFANRSVWKAVLDKLSNKKIIQDQYGVDVKDLTRSDVAGIAKEAFKPTGPIYTPPSYGEPRSYPSPPPTGPKPKRGKGGAKAKEAVGEAFEGLDALFGVKKQLAQFDENRYQQAMPHFKKSLDAAIAAGKEFKDFAADMIKRYGDAIRPYIERFMKDMGVKGEEEKGLTKVAADSAVPQKDFIKSAETVATTPLSGPRGEKTVRLGRDIVRSGKAVFKANEPVVLTEYENGYEIKRGGQKVRIEDIEELGLAGRESAPAVPYTETPIAKGASKGFSPQEIEKKANSLADGARESWGKAEYIDKDGETKTRWFKQYTVKVGDEFVTGNDKATLRRKLVEALNRVETKKMAASMKAPVGQVPPSPQPAAGQPGTKKPTTPPPQRVVTADTTRKSAVERMAEELGQKETAPPKPVEVSQRTETKRTPEDVIAEKRAAAIRAEREQHARDLEAENERLKKTKATAEADRVHSLLKEREDLLALHNKLKGKPETAAKRLEISTRIELIEEEVASTKLRSALSKGKQELVDKIKEHFNNTMILAPALGLAGGIDIDANGNITWDKERALGAASLAMFVGPKAKSLTYRHMMGLKEAEGLWKSAGIKNWSPEANSKLLDIQKKTGWFLGKDGKARFEQSDAKARLRKPVNKMPFTTRMRLSDVLQHDRLFEQYPVLNNWTVERALIDSNGATGMRTKRIQVNAGLEGEEFMDTLLHEVQHVVDVTEGRYGGANRTIGLAILFEPKNAWGLNDFIQRVRGELIIDGNYSRPLVEAALETFNNRLMLLRNVYAKYVDNEMERGTIQKEMDSYGPNDTRSIERLAGKLLHAREAEKAIMDEIASLWKLTKSDKLNGLVRGLFEVQGYRNALGEIDARIATQRRMMTQQDIDDFPLLSQVVATAEYKRALLSDKPSPANAAASERLTPEEQAMLDRSRRGEIAEQSPELVLEGYKLGRKQKKIQKQISTDNLKNFFQTFRGKMVDVSGNIKADLIKKAGAEGEWAKRRRNLIYGAPARISRILEKGDEPIYGKLNKAEMNILDDIIETRTNISILTRNPEYTPEFGQKMTAQKGALDLLKKKYGDELYAKLDARASAYFEDMRSALKMAYEGGLIDKITYDKLKNNEYKRKQLQDLIDPEDKTEIPKLMGAKISVRKSGIEYLREGSQRLYDTDSHWARAQVWTSVVGRVAKNRANLALVDIYNKNPKNGIIRVLKEWEDPPAGESAISYHENGQVKRLSMPNEMAKEWVTTDPEISKGFAYFLSVFTGTKLLKAFATGYNPAFILTNIPRDMMLIWAATDEYSSFLPKAMLQMGKDMALASKDAATKTGRYDKYIDQGGGIELLTYYGRGDVYSHKLNMLQKVAGWAGETSELMTRLALRDRTIKNRLESMKREPTPEERKLIEKEATEISRNYLDFNQGGSWAKSIDKIVPYFNASIQAARGLMRVLKENPKMAAYKMAQVATSAAMLYLYNQSADPEAWEQIPDFDKVNNWCIVVPGAYYIDDKGDKRYYYIKIAKDQGMQVVSSMIDASFEYNRTGKVPKTQLWEAAKNIIQTQLIPPIMGAYAAYEWNVDVWTGERVYKGREEVEPWAERDKKTVGFFDDVGQLTGLSPMRLRAAMGRIVPESNAFWTGGLGGYKVMSGELQDDWNRKTATQILSELPALRRVLSSTNPYWEVREESKRHKIESATRRKVNSATIDNLADRYFKDRTPDTAEKIDKYLEEMRKNDPYEAERLENRIVRHWQFWQVPNRQWWVDLSMLNDPEQRAEMFHERYVKSNPEKRQELLKILESIKGIESDRFNQRMNELVSR